MPLPLFTCRALREQVLSQVVEGAPVSGEDGVYRGMNNYRDFRAGFRREHTVGAEKGSGAHGPLRASTNVRMTVRFDYQPDICKDYKETGYCGYGDACKFMHDRGDYKSGWELDRVSATA
jgi:RING finger protein 113A